MTDDTFNMSLRTFLKTVGLTSQGEIENAVRSAEEAGTLPSGSVTARMVLKIEAIDLEHEVVGEIEMPTAD